MSATDIIQPPHSTESEQAILGGLMLDRNAFDRIADIVTEADFYVMHHRLIFAAVQRLAEKAVPVDVITVSEALERSCELTNIGGLAYLGAMAQNTPSAANIRRYAETVRDRSILRKLQTIANDLHASCANASDKSFEAIAAEAESRIMEAVDRHSGDPKTLTNVFSDVLRYSDERREHGGSMAGLATGFGGLDRLTGGIEPGQLVILAARPSVGKTMAALNIADYVTSNGKSALFFSLEMSAREIGMRLLSAKSGVSVHAMRGGGGSESHWNRMNEQTSRANKQRLLIDDKGAIGVGYIRAKARRIKRQHGLDLVVIDYLQLMTGKGDNRTQEIGAISRGLKALAKELNVPIIALAQLNRGLEARPDRRPLMSDLRDSGEVEQDADLVAMLHREELHNPAPEWSGLAELIIRKNRNGPLGDVLLKFEPEAMRFVEHIGTSPRQVEGYQPMQRKPRGL